MPMELTPRTIAKPWGVLQPPPPFAANGERIGEIWFEAPSVAALPLLVKLLFTSERLSVQVHPDDDHARRLGLPHGKEEAWYVLAAAPDATIGLGLPGARDRDDAAAAARDGRIVEMMEWRPVRAGDVIYVPGGTVHALGPGLQLVEIQQALDLTWRLYDYGRPRELHLAEGLAVARLEAFGANAVARAIDTARTVRSEGGRFVLEELHGLWTGMLNPPTGAPVWLVMLAGTAALDGAAIAEGTVWLCEAAARLEIGPDARCLIAYVGGTADPALLRADGAP